MSGASHRELFLGAAEVAESRGDRARANELRRQIGEPPIVDPHPPIESLCWDDYPVNEDDDGSRWVIIALDADKNPHPHQRAILAMVWGFAFTRTRVAVKARELRGAIERSRKVWASLGEVDQGFDDCHLFARCVRPAEAA